ncbi:MAG TPA: hypothetical protein VFU43_14445 [Streptosporangiaceae bacterium]|nr:hypothetical protein [Streptosporangiaceae bacterium]
MELTPYVDRLRGELAVAAEAGGDDARALAERLTRPLDAATRLVLMEALSAAADEITSDLAPGAVEVRLRGRDPAFVVTPPPPEEPFDEAPAPPGGLPGAAAEADEGGEGGEGRTSRITLRLPEHLKPRIDEAATRAGLSVNAWLVRVVSAALAPDDPGRSTGPGPGRPDGAPLGRRYTGWVR